MFSSILSSIKIDRLLFLKFLKILAFFESYFCPFNKTHEKIIAIFFISAIMASIWNVFIKFHWDDEKLITEHSITVQYMYMDFNFWCFFQNSTISFAICLPLPFSPLTYWLRTWCMILGLAWLAWNHSAFYCLQYHLLSQYTTPSLWYVNLHSGKVGKFLIDWYFFEK